MPRCHLGDTCFRHLRQCLISSFGCHRIKLCDAVWLLWLTQPLSHRSYIARSRNLYHHMYGLITQEHITGVQHVTCQKVGGGSRVWVSGLTSFTYIRAIEWCGVVGLEKTCLWVQRERVQCFFLFLFRDKILRVFCFKFLVVVMFRA